MEMYEIKRLWKYYLEQYIEEGYNQSLSSELDLLILAIETNENNVLGMFFEKGIQKHAWY